MNTPLRRIRRGAIVLASIIVAGVLGYHYLGEYDWIHAIWMVVVTISSVGYGEVSHSPSHIQLFSVVIIILGMSAAFYTVGGLIQLMLEGEIQTALGQQRNTREIRRLVDHIIICGYGRIGEILTQDLLQRNHLFVVIDSDPARISEASQHQFLTVSGDAMEEEILQTAGIEKARTIVSVLPNDAANVFITLTARNLNPNIQIIARAEQSSTEKKLRQAGANRVVMPAVTGANRMSRMITSPSTADLMERLSESSTIDVEMDEIEISPASLLVGSTVAETQARRKHGILIVAVKEPAGDMIFNPDSSHVFQQQATVIVLGGANAIQHFRRECEVAAE